MLGYKILMCTWSIGKNERNNNVKCKILFIHGIIDANVQNVSDRNQMKCLQSLLKVNRIDEMIDLIA